MDKKTNNLIFITRNKERKSVSEITINDFFPSIKSINRSFMKEPEFVNFQVYGCILGQDNKVSSFSLLDTDEMGMSFFLPSIDQEFDSDIVDLEPIEADDIEEEDELIDDKMDEEIDRVPTLEEHKKIMEEIIPTVIDDIKKEIAERHSDDDNVDSPLVLPKLDREPTKEETKVSSEKLDNSIDSLVSNITKLDKEKLPHVKKLIPEPPKEEENKNVSPIPVVKRLKIDEVTGELIDE